jgi:hypothetical protein
MNDGLQGIGDDVMDEATKQVHTVSKQAVAESLLPTLSPDLPCKKYS